MDSNPGTQNEESSQIDSTKNTEGKATKKPVNITYPFEVHYSQSPLIKSQKKSHFIHHFSFSYPFFSAKVP